MNSSLFSGPMQRMAAWCSCGIEWSLQQVTDIEFEDELQSPQCWTSRCCCKMKVLISPAICCSPSSRAVAGRLLPCSNARIEQRGQDLANYMENRRQNHFSKLCVNAADPASSFTYDHLALQFRARQPAPFSQAWHVAS